MKQQPFTVKSVREDKGKSYWTRLGVAFPTENGGFIQYLDAIPAPVDGQYKIILFPPKAEDAGDAGTEVE